MKKFFATLIIICAVFNIQTVNAFSAKSYVVIEQTSGRILYKQNCEQKLTMASTTKVMTALIALEKMDLEKVYDIPDCAIGIEGSSIYLKKGEKLSGKDLVYGLMIASGNDAAYAIANIVCSSTEEFVALMNEKAKDLGLKNTHFADPCGLASKNHYTTAIDLANLCAIAMKNQQFEEIVSTQNYKIAGQDGQVRYLHNKNRVLGELQGGNGIKTGYTMAAGRCLCSSAKRGDMQLICVVLNDYDWFNDSKALLEKGFEEFELVKLCEKNNFASNCNIYGGKEKKCDIIYNENFFYPIKKTEKLTVNVNSPALINAPIQKGQSAGSADIFLDGRLIYTVQCVFEKDIEKKFSLFGR